MKPGLYTAYSEYSNPASDVMFQLPPACQFRDRVQVPDVQALTHGSFPRSGAQIQTATCYDPHYRDSQKRGLPNGPLIYGNPHMLRTFKRIQHPGSDSSTYQEHQATRWVVVKVMVPFWVPQILGTVTGTPKRDHNFDNPPDWEHRSPTRGF